MASGSLPEFPDATTNPLKRKIRFTLGALPSELSGFSEEPYKLYADGALLKKGVADADGALMWEHKEGTQQYKIELATGQAFLVDAQDTFAADKDIAATQRLANAGYRSYTHEASEKALHGMEGDSFRQLIAGKGNTPDTKG